MSKINIALCIDNNFAMQCGVFMTSVILTSPRAEIHFFIIANSIDNRNKEKLSKIVEKHTNISLSFIDIDAHIFSKFPIRQGDHVSLAAYYRILLPEILPQDCSKVLYFDCDMIAIDTIEPLWNTDISTESTAAVPDMFCNRTDITMRLGYNATENYYNSGVLLISLDYWRKNNIAQKGISFISEYPERCVAHDQDALNAVLHGTIKTLSARYNVQQDFLRRDPSILVINDAKILADITHCAESPCIIHYTGPSKPWMYECFNPYKSLWQFFQQKTPWKNQKRIHEYTGNRLSSWRKQRIKEILHLIPQEKDLYKDCTLTIQNVKNSISFQNI